MKSERDLPRPKAPVSAYVLMLVTGLALAATVGLVAATVREGGDDRLLAFAVFAGTTAGPWLSVTWFVFVARHTVRPDPHRADNAESRWMTEATSSTFHDLVIACGVTLFLVSISGIEIRATAILAGILLVAAIDTAVRYRLLKRRAA